MPAAQRTSGARQRHVPQRTCVSCRTTSAKRELIRLVRTADGHVEVDPTGKRSGRGAYLCTNRRCWDLALHRGLLSRALKVAVSPEDRERLALHAAGLSQRETQ